MKEMEPNSFAVPRRTPWWVSVLLAICSYCALKYIVPELQPTSPVLQKMIQAAPQFAPLVTIPFLLLEAKQLYDSDLPDKNQQEDINEENSDQ
jgi:hypothetical protein